MKSRVQLAAVLLFGLMLPMVGCGDDDGESSPAASDETEDTPTTGGTAATTAGAALEDEHASG